MSLSFDVFTGAFLAKVSEFEFIQMDMSDRTDLIDGYMARAISEFKKNCKVDLISTADPVARAFSIDIPESDIDELANIISEGMLVQWMKPFVYKQENLENLMNTKDFQTYAPSNLLMRICEAYKNAQTDYKQMIREYSYNHGDLTELHL